MTDKERIETIMSEYHLNNVAFCNKVGMNQATLSNILRGTTNPSLPVLRSIKDAFPEISTDWLYEGEGEMLKTENAKNPDSTSGQTSMSGDLFSGVQNNDVDTIFAPMSNLSSGSSDGRQSASYSPKSQQEVRPVAPTVNVGEIVTGVVSALQKPTRKIVEVRIFFDDGTFEAFSS